MPRKSKEENNKIEQTSVKKVSRNRKKDNKEIILEKQGTSKKGTSKKSTSIKIASKKVNKKEKTPSKNKKTNVNKVSSKSTKKTTSSKKNTTRKKVEKNKKIDILEYYDLPYRYNETIVKILAQTPNTLFVYWDISDKDKENYINQYGPYFFNNTKPVLVVHNKTQNYSFEVDINDYANSWYLHVSDSSNCNFQVELGRRPINNYVNIANDYLYITNSNDVISQNDHILFDKLSHQIYFKNVKTNSTYSKNILSLSLLQKIGKFNINLIKEFYKKLYPNEKFDIDKLDLRNPSSGNPTSTFK